jgi:hypothetical protein
MKPSEFFIDVLDLFAVILPGAIVTFALRAVLPLLPTSLGASIFECHALTGPPGWLAFGIASYVVGHIIFSLSARLDSIYDSLEGSRVSDALYEAVTKIREKQEDAVRAATSGAQGSAARSLGAIPWYLSPLAFVVQARRADFGGGEAAPDHAMNALRTSLSTLQMRHPGALTEVRRLEADSKFFRSAVLLLFCFFWFLVGRNVWLAVRHDVRGCIGDFVSAVICWWFTRLSFARYCEQRKKSVERAYQLLVTSVAVSGLTGAVAASDKAED